MKPLYGDPFSQISGKHYQLFRSLGGAAVHHKSLGLLQVCSNFVHFFLFSFGSGCSESHHLPPSWFITAGKMRDFWGQMCFHSTIIMPLKILIALAVFLGVPGLGPQLGLPPAPKEERKGLVPSGPC